MAISRSDRYTFTQTRDETFASDFAPDFIPHPDTGDIMLIKNDNAIKQSLRNILLTQPLQRPHSSRFGGGLQSMLFEPATPDTAASIKEIVYELVGRLEPRVRLQEVTVTYLEGQESYQVTLYFYMINNTELVSLDVILYRVR